MAPYSASLGMRDDAFSSARFSLPLKAHLEVVVEEEEKKSTHRRVRFAREQGNVVINPEPEYYSDEDIQVKWFCAAELQQCRVHAKELANRLMRTSFSPGDGSDLEMAHRKTTLMLAQDFHSLLKLPATTPDHDLSIWCAQDDGRRGLERFSSKTYCCFRRKDLFATRAHVLSEQQRQRSANISDVELIAQRAREASRRSRTFALFFGNADARQIVSNDIDPLVQRYAPPRKRSKLCHMDEPRSIYSS